MPATDAGWQVWTSAEWTAELRDVLDGRIGFALDYVDTIDGDHTAAVGEVAFSADQGLALAIDAGDPRRAGGAALDTAVGSVVRRRPATKSRYTVTVDQDGLIPVGSIFRDEDSRSWKTVVTGGVVSLGDELILEALDSGPIELSQIAPTPLVPVTALAQPSDLTYTPADTYTVGRVVETDGSLRRRWSVSMGRPNSGTGPGIYRTLTALTWVTAISAVRASAGVLQIYVVPEPVGTDQEEELAEAIYSCIGADVTTTGTSSEVIEAVDGQSLTISWTVGTTSAVTVAITLTLASGVVVADVEDAVEAAAQAAFDLLEVGNTIYLDAPGGVRTLVGQVAGVIGVAVLLNGVAGPVTPGVATTLLTRGTTTIV